MSHRDRAGARMLTAIVVLATSVPCRDLSAGDPLAERTNSVERIVRFEYRVANLADGPQDIEVRLPLPRTNERQDVLLLREDPGHDGILEDARGNRVARYVERAVEPGGCRARGWIAAVRVHAAVYLPDAGAALTPEERAALTRDDVKYQVSSPEVVAARDACVRAGMSDEEKAGAIFRWLVHNVTYLRDDEWVPAPEVIRTGKGSCSEFNYALVALLRSSGIPCRWTGGLVLTQDNETRYDAAIHEDRVFHRWTEAWLEGKGWLSLDASRGASAVRRFDNYRNLWGRLPAGLLQTWRGDGGGDGLVGWQYVAEARSAGRVGAFATAYWIEEPVERLETALGEVTAVLDGTPAEERILELARDRLRREVLLFGAGRREEELSLPLARALGTARHPSAIRFSLVAARAGREVPPDLRLDALADRPLADRVTRTLAGGPRAWSSYEDLWRKTRAAIRFDEASGRFSVVGP